MSNLDWSNLSKHTAKELLEAGFGDWDHNLLLVPEKLKDKIPLGTAFVDIFYNSVIYGKDTDSDTRYGCFSFGVIPDSIKEERRKYAEDDGVIYE